MANYNEILTAVIHTYTAFYDLMYDFEEKGILTSNEELLKLFRPVADNFYKYLNGVYNDTIE